MRPSDIVKNPDLDSEPQPLPCAVCGTQSNVERNYSGLTGYGAGMAGVSCHHYDLHTCPHSGEPWHVQAQRLLEERNMSSSPSVRALIGSDIKELLAKHAKTPPPDFQDKEEHAQP